MISAFTKAGSCLNEPQRERVGSGRCSYVVTGLVVCSGLKACPYSGYRASQTLVVDDNGAILNDFLMAGPSATGDGAVKTVYTSDGSYLVVTEQANPVASYTVGIQKYGPTGSLLWTKAYYEPYHQEDGDHLLKIAAGAVAESGNGHVIAGSSYDSVTQNPPLGAYYHFKVDKETGSKVAWNKKYRVWPDWNGVYVQDLTLTPDGGLLATIDDGVSTEDDRILKTSQKSGSLAWMNEYGANLGAVVPGIGGITVAKSAFDAVLARLSVSGEVDDSCKALPISIKTNEASAHPILRTDVFEGFGPSGCNSEIGRATAYDVSLLEAGKFHSANSCAPNPELSVTGNGDFGTVQVGSSSYDIAIRLSNYNGLTNLNVGKVLLSDSVNFELVSNSCSGQTLYPSNEGTPTDCTTTIRFSPLSNGAKQCVVKFGSNNETPIKTVLKGNGRGAAFLSVVITPQAAVNAGARWNVDGGAWKRSGVKIQAAPGLHVVSFKTVSGWKKPANKKVTLVADQLKSVGGAYVKSTP